MAAKLDADLANPAVLRQHQRLGPALSRRLGRAAWAPTQLCGRGGNGHRESRIKFYGGGHGSTDGSTTSAMHPSLSRSYTPFLLDDSSEAEVDTSSLRKDSGALGSPPHWLKTPQCLAHHCLVWMQTIEPFPPSIVSIWLFASSKAASDISFQKYLVNTCDMANQVQPTTRLTRPRSHQ